MYNNLINSILTKEKIEELYQKLGYDSDYPPDIFEISTFLNDVGILDYGDTCFENFESRLIDRNGNLINICLDNNLSLEDGAVLSKSDDWCRSAEISRINERTYELLFTNDYTYNSEVETPFYAIKVSCFEDGSISTYVIDPNFNVIAKFQDLSTYGHEYEGYKNCHVYTERNFFFVSSNREYLVFSQKKIVNCDDKRFQQKHIADISPESIEEYCDEDYNLVSNVPIESDFSDEEWDKIVRKNDKKMDCENEENKEDDYLPHLDDIALFYDNSEEDRKDFYLHDYYQPSYGIIDCKMTSKIELKTFTEWLSYAITLVWQRKPHISDYNYNRLGWNFDESVFYGHVINDKFLEYPDNLNGFSLYYAILYYPDEILRAIKNGEIVITNKMLNTLPSNVTTREIRRVQEIHLKYNDIKSVGDTIDSTEIVGLKSSFQGKTLRNVIYTKGGTKYLVNLVMHGKLNIDIDVLYNLRECAENEIEKECYDILITKIDKIKELEEDQRAQYFDKIEKEGIEEANRQFEELMDDMEAWGNIDL